MDITVPDNNENDPPLKRCPFCGSKAEYRRVGYELYCVRCTLQSCAAEQQVYLSKEKAAWHWNQRVWI